jgi:hypothetical protein
MRGLDPGVPGMEPSLDRAGRVRPPPPARSWARTSPRSSTPTCHPGPWCSPGPRCHPGGGQLTLRPSRHPQRRDGHRHQPLPALANLWLARCAFRTCGTPSPSPCPWPRPCSAVARACTAAADRSVPGSADRGGRRTRPPRPRGKHADRATVALISPRLPTRLSHASH